MAITNNDLLDFMNSNVDYSSLATNQYTNKSKVDTFLKDRISQVRNNETWYDAQVAANEVRAKTQEYEANQGVRGAVWDTIGDIAGDRDLQVGINKYLSSRQSGIDHNAIWNSKNSIPFSTPSASYEPFSKWI